MRAEFFSAECQLCEGTLNTLNHTFSDIEIDIHRASECKDGSCCALAAQYGVLAVPSLAVDGKVVLMGLPDKDDVKRLSIMFQR